MKVEVEPQPLREPLPGGKVGSTVTVEPLVAGHFDFPLPLMEKPQGRFLTVKLLASMLRDEPRRRIPVVAFLVRHPTAGPILVDTGLHPSVATDPGENFGRLAAKIARPSLDPGEDVSAQLRERGLEASAISTVLLTHLHSDHTSAISEFPTATFILSSAEWEAGARGPKPTSNGYRRAHIDYAFDYRTIDFNEGRIDSYASFGRCFDLFGDGSIHLAFTPGHSAGHMSVVCRLARRDFVIGGDVMYVRGQLDGTAPLPPRPFDAHNYRRSLQELRLFVNQYPDAIVTPGHDPEFYAGLEPSYA